MSSDTNNNNWIADTVGDFIHSSIWAAPVHTFIEARCAAFDYDDDDDETSEMNTASTGGTSLEEQINIHKDYTRLVDALIHSLGQDLSLNEDELNKVCQIPIDSQDSVMIDESYEQLYAARDFQLFQEMMRRKNLILQLQALVSLQLQWGLLKQNDTNDDLVLSLLMQATASSSSTTPNQKETITQREEPIQQPIIKQQLTQKHVQHEEEKDDDDDVVGQPERFVPPPTSTHQRKPKIEPKRPSKEQINLPDLRHRGGGDVDTDWYRNLRQNTQQKTNKNNNDNISDNDDDDQSKKSSTLSTISAVPQEVLREKLRQLTDQTSLVDEKTAAAIRERKDFLQKQRDEIIKKQKQERAKDLEQETNEHEQQSTRQARPQSAALVARRAMATTANKSNQKQDEQQNQIPDDELIKRRAMAAKLRREVVDKR